MKKHISLNPRGELYVGPTVEIHPYTWKHVYDLLYSPLFDDLSALNSLPL